MIKGSMDVPWKKFKANVHDSPIHMCNSLV